MALTFAIMYSLIAFCLWLLSHGKAMSARGITLHGTILTYFIGAMGAGVIVGLLRPWARTAVGAAVVATVAAFPITVAVNTLAEGNPLQWSRGYWVGVGFLTIVLGVCASTVFTEKPVRDSKGGAL